MSNELEFGRGYKEIGLAAEANAEFKKVPASVSAYDEARAELMTLADQSDIAEQGREADAGLKLIRSGSRLPHLINQTALRLHFAGRTREAYDLTREMTEFLEWDAADHYGLACYASQIGEWKEAAKEMLSGLGKDAGRMSIFDRMFSDLDLEPFYSHAAEGAMDIETAFVLADPLFGAALSKLAGREVEFDGILLREMPRRWLPFLNNDLVSGFYSIAPQAPDRMQGYIRKWLQSEYAKIAALARRGIERAREMILDTQLEFATTAAKRGDFFAARYHALFAVTRKPERFAEFEASLSPLGMEYFFGDIRAAMKDDSNFLKLISFITPSIKLNPQQMMEVLDDCETGKATVFWMLLRASVARELEGPAVARDWYIEVIRRWPDDPAPFLNLLLIYENTKQWDAAGLLLANVPPAFYHLSAAEMHARRIELREIESPQAYSGYAPFYGQPDIGGIVKNEPAPQKSFPERIMKKPNDESRSQKYEEKA
jgi:hypothetical protein